VWSGCPWFPTMLLPPPQALVHLQALARMVFPVLQSRRHPPLEGTEDMLLLLFKQQLLRISISICPILRTRAEDTKLFNVVMVIRSSRMGLASGNHGSRKSMSVTPPRLSMSTTSTTVRATTTVITEDTTTTASRQ